MNNIQHLIIDKMVEGTQLITFVGQIYAKYPRPDNMLNNDLILIFEQIFVKNDAEIESYLQKNLENPTIFQRVIEYNFYDVGLDKHYEFQEYVQSSSTKKELFRSVPLNFYVGKQYFDMYSISIEKWYRKYLQEKIFAKATSYYLVTFYGIYLRIAEIYSMKAQKIYKNERIIKYKCFKSPSEISIYIKRKLEEYRETKKKNIFSIFLELYIKKDPKYKYLLYPGEHEMLCQFLDENPQITNWHEFYDNLTNQFKYYDNTYFAMSVKSFDEFL